MASVLLDGFLNIFNRHHDLIAITNTPSNPFKRMLDYLYILLIRERTMKKKLMTSILIASLLMTGASNPIVYGQEESSSEAESSQELSTESADADTASLVDFPEEHSGHFLQEFDLSHHEAKDKVRLWIPYAESNDYQEISNVKIEVSDESVEYEVTEDELGNKMIYVEWPADKKDRKLTYSFDVTRKRVDKPEFKEEEAIDKDEFAQYLTGSKLVPIGDEMKELSDEISQEDASVEDKVRAIYKWIFDNMVRNEDVVGCGTGDALDSIASLDGKCTDIHSVFIGLARAQGIPSREVFGVRMKDEDGDVTGSQHCWAEYYQPGTGWVAIDVADVLKMVLNKELDKSSPEAQTYYDYYYGNLDPLRVAFSTGRDLTLNPEQEAGPVNQFGYPYAEVDGQALDCYQAEDFGYHFDYQLAE